MRNANRRSRGSRLPQEEGPLPGDITVRVIEFLITVASEDGTTRTERYRAVTTLLDWRRYPAADLAAAYARRWGIETAYREAKSYLAGSRVLRSRTPRPPPPPPRPRPPGNLGPPHHLPGHPRPHLPRRRRHRHRPRPSLLHHRPARRPPDPRPRNHRDPGRRGRDPRQP